MIRPSIGPGVTFWGRFFDFHAESVRNLIDEY
jgi:hypothetical protein